MYSLILIGRYKDKIYYDYQFNSFSLFLFCNFVSYTKLQQNIRVLASSRHNYKYVSSVSAFKNYIISYTEEFRVVVNRINTI